MALRNALFVALSVAAVACAPSATTSRPKATDSGAKAAIPPATQRELHACYAEAQKYNPRLAGELVAEVKVGPRGGVERVDAQDVVGLNRNVIRCLTERLYQARFDATPSTTLRIPLAFKA